MFLRPQNFLKKGFKVFPSRIYYLNTMPTISSDDVCSITENPEQVGTTLASPVFGYVDHPALQALFGLTAASTIISAISYLISKDTYKVLKKKI